MLFFILKNILLHTTASYRYDNMYLKSYIKLIKIIEFVLAYLITDKH